EGFTEAKINTNSAGRSFIGATAEGKIIMGTMKSATLKTAAAACQQLGLVNAMCLDGGGSVGLYYNGSVKTAGRAVNNALGFMISSGNAKGAVQTVTVDSISKSMQAYNIGGNNYFKLRDVAAVISGSGKQFEVGYDNAAKSILLTTGKAYTPIGGELSGKDASLLNAPKGAGKILVNGQEKRLDCYTIGGANYFKLRDLGALFDFGVNWNNESKIIEIHTDASYQ
ncbi:MAG: phosphodiester glycosidase family protein, partial [Christensenellaceae bacterium]